MSRGAEVWKEIRGLVVDNFLYKLVAMLFAVTIWAWVQSEQVVEERLRIPLRWVLPDALTTVEPPIESVTLTVEGVQAYVRAVRQKELGITVDLGAAEEGTANVDLTAQVVRGLPEQVRVLSVSPSTLQVQLDGVLRRRVPIRVGSKGEVAAGYVLDGLTATPDRVEVVGPASVVRALEEVATDPVDVSGLRESVDLPVGLLLKKAQLSVPRGTAVNVHVEVKAVVEERSFEGVPVVVRSTLPVTPSVTSFVVVLGGPEGALARVDPGGLSILVYVPPDFSGTAQAALGGEGLHFEVVHPGGGEIEVVRVEPRTLTVSTP